MMVRSRIKIIIVVIFFIALSIALYLRRPKYTWELKWGEGPMTCSEQAYYDNHIPTIINKWRETGLKEQEQPDSQSKELYKSLLVIDFDKKVLWLEKNGRISEDDYFELPPGVNWTLHHYYSKKYITLNKGRIILKIPDKNTFQKNPERLYLQSSGRGVYLNYIVIDTLSPVQQPGIYVNSSGTVIPITNVNSTESAFVVSEDEYQRYINSLADSDISEIDQNDFQSEGPSLLKENKAAWKRIEKKLYMEIERNVLKAGFQLKFVSMAPYANFTGANAYVVGNNSNLITEILDRSPDVNTSLGIIRLKDDIWYAASRPEPKRTRSNRTMKLEFLIYLDVNMSPSQKKEYINQGREKFKKQFGPRN